VIKGIKSETDKGNRKTTSALFRKNKGFGLNINMHKINIKIDEKMDHGPIVSQFKEEIQKADNSRILGERIFERSAQVLIDLLPAYIKGKISLYNCVTHFNYYTGIGKNFKYR